MNEALSQLDRIHTIIETDKSSLRKFVVAFQYGAHDASSSRVEPSLTTKKRRLTKDDLEGPLTVTIGSDDACWWGISLDGPELKKLVAASCDSALSSSSSSSRPVEPTTEQYEQFVDKILSALKRQSVMIGMKKSSRASDGSYPFTKLYIDVETSPIQLKLSKLDDRLARVRSTDVLLSSTLYPLSDTATSKSSISNDTESISTVEYSQLQRKLETTQQALREERHKYRSLLAAPSAANARAGRRPVVGLGPALPSAASQRSQLVTRTPSSPTSGSRSRSNLPSSSSSSEAAGGGGPSSDDLVTLAGDVHDKPSQSQRTLSLVNPTRVRRADPRENDGFVGDDDE